MIDPTTVEEIEDGDGEVVHCFGLDSESDQWRWQWLPVETLIEAGRGDLVPWLGERKIIVPY